MPTIDHINGYLEAFALLNSGSNCEPNFTLSQLADAGSNVASVEQHLHPYENYQINVEALNGRWDQHISQLSLKWLFLNARFSDEAKHAAVNRLLELVKSIGCTRSTFFYNVTISAANGDVLKPWYEATWSDTLLKTDDDLLLLHFGVSD